ncbi:MAG: hypothetical protein U1E53_33000, partial [Dongiaceae bacterium]
LEDGKEMIATTVLDGLPDAILKMPEDSLVPLLLTVVMTAGFAGLLAHLWWLAGAGAALTLACTLLWLWPERRLAQTAGPRHG